MLELLRWAVAQRRVEPATVIVLIDEGFHVGAQVHEIPIRVGVDLLPRERFQETLAAGVVLGVRRSAHARDHLVLLEHLHVVTRGILDAAI